MESVKTVEIVEIEFDRKCWKDDPNKYAREYYKLKNKEIISCICGKEVKKLLMCHHIKSKCHKYNIMKLQLEEMKQEKIETDCLGKKL